MKQVIPVDFIKMIPMRMEEFKTKAHPLHVIYSFSHTVFGEILIASTSKGICNLVFSDDRTLALNELKSHYLYADYSEGIDETHRQIVDFFNAKCVFRHPVMLHIKGTSFQHKVWKELLTIPSGETLTYGEIAQRTGNPRSARAVGTAVGNNKVSLLIPCHRVVASGFQHIGDNDTKFRKLGGYRWGISRKIALLKWEQNE